MKRLLASSLLAASLTACDTNDSGRAADSARAIASVNKVDSARSDDSSQTDTRCPGATNTFECARAIEKDVLHRDAKHARRSGDSLILVLDNKSVRVFADSGKDAESVSFSYRAYLPSLALHVIHEQYYEGSAFNLVSARTGRSQYIPEEPVVSPSGRRIASASAEEVTGYSPNQLMIWRGAGDSLALELDLQPQSFGFDRARWVDDSTLDLVRVLPSETSPEGRREPAHATYRAGKWHVDTLAPRA